MTFSEGYYYQEKFHSLSSSKETIRVKTFEECEFTGCSFLECKFEKTTFLNCKLNDCILSAVIPLDCRLNEVKFTGCKVIGIDWTKAHYLRGLEFTGCQINYSSFKLLKIPKTRLIQCEAREVDYTETDLSQGSFRGTDFEKSLFFKTNLTGADFSGAKNYSIDVKNNTLKQAKFSLPEAMSLLKGLDIILE